MKMLMEEMKCEVVLPMTVYIDNQSAMKISTNDIYHNRTKHIDIKYNYIKEEIKNKNIQLKWVETRKQLADILTKAVPGPQFSLLRDKLLKRITA